ncbi:MAG: RES family NAD+ phosphorylase, partial [Polyangiaceae bacterium]
MSSNIWMQCGAKPNVAHHQGVAWRVVEDQHRISTRRLVDTDEEHELLEALIDTSKPALPDTAPRGLHYLLFTPFRYPPLRYGSRFGTRRERGIWYGSEQIKTALSEVAYYRLLFLEGTAAAREIAPLFLVLTVFNVDLKSERAVDLSRAPFRRHREIISSKTDYLASQALGRDMREAGIELFR